MRWLRLAALLCALLPSAVWAQRIVPESWHHHSMARSGLVDPARVRFTQDSIASTFENGKSIQTLADALRAREVQPQNIPPIRLFWHRGHLHSLDNRRLEAFRRAGLRIPYRFATADEVRRERWKLSSRNDGTSIRIRGGGASPAPRAVHAPRRSGNRWL